ncbi:MAG: hypothetical protein JOZ75_10895, partial [Candidatus Dormibacteraeota bacterium]|nr:hypothetical protein [Candidatus Dormibacteraeota bacterium]
MGMHRTSSASPNRLGAALVGLMIVATVAVLVVPRLVAAAPSPTNRIDMRVLVVDDGGPNVTAIAAELQREGVPYTDVSLASTSRPAITPAFLSSGSEAFYQGVVLPNETGGSLSSTELSALLAFESNFGIREIDAYTWAHPAVGLNYAQSPGYVGALDGMTATVTAAGQAAGWTYLNGPVPFTPGSYGYLATPLATQATGASFTTLVTMPIPSSTAVGSVVGDYKTTGREQLVVTTSLSDGQGQFKLLAHGLIT